MLSLALITVGFLLATAAVIALARASTARWERDKRAAVAVRADGSTRRSSAAGSATGRLAVVRPGLAAVRGHLARIPPAAALGRLLSKGVQLGASRLQPVRRQVGALRSSLLAGTTRGRWTRSRSPALPADGDGADPAPAPGPSRAATDVPSDGVVPITGGRLLRRTSAPGRRRALAFLHRHAAVRDAPITPEDRDESSTAR